MLVPPVLSRFGLKMFQKIQTSGSQTAIPIKNEKQNISRCWSNLFALFLNNLGITFWNFFFGSE